MFVICFVYVVKRFEHLIKMVMALYKSYVLLFIIIIVWNIHDDFYDEYGILPRRTKRGITLDLQKQKKKSKKATQRAIILWHGTKYIQLFNKVHIYKKIHCTIFFIQTVHRSSGSQTLEGAYKSNI